VWKVAGRKRTIKNIEISIIILANETIKTDLYSRKNNKRRAKRLYEKKKKNYNTNAALFRYYTRPVKNDNGTRLSDRVDQRKKNKTTGVRNETRPSRSFGRIKSSSRRRVFTISSSNEKLTRLYLDALRFTSQRRRKLFRFNRVPPLYSNREVLNV